MVSTPWPFRAAAGARAPFPPCGHDPTAAREAADELRHLVRRTPRACGIDQTRWTLAAIGTACDWLSQRSSSCVHRMLKRFCIVWKRARAAVRSPDPLYAAKLAVVEQVRAKAAARPGRIVGVYLDEGTIDRQPTLAHDYASHGPGHTRP